MKNKKVIFKFLPIIIILFVSVLLTFSIFKEIKNLGFSLSILKPSYTVVYNSNGGTGSMENQIFKYGTAQNLRTNTFTKTDYVFDEWNTEPDGTGNSYTDEESVNNLTNQNGATVNLYAQWKIRDTVITFDPNGGTTPSFETKTITNSSVYGELPTTTRSNYVFKGWKITSNYIPSNYQEMDYVVFNSGSYINTEIIPTNHAIEIKFDFDQYSNNEHLFGTSLGYSYYSFSASNNKYSFGKSNSSGNYGTWSTGIHTLLYNEGVNNEIILDNDTIDTGNTINSYKTLMIGKRGNEVTFEGKIYYIKITDKSTGELVRNLIPCYRISDDEVGFYDTVNNKFYTNSATNGGSLSKGNDINYIQPSTELYDINDHTLYAIWTNDLTVYLNPGAYGTVSPNRISANYGNPYGTLPTPEKSGSTFKGWKINENFLPDEYQEVEYIKFNSGNYIDTGVIPTYYTTEIIFDFQEYEHGEILFGTSTYSANYYFGTRYNSYYWTSSLSGGTWSTGQHTLIYNGEYEEVKIDDTVLVQDENRYDNNTLLIGKSNTTTNFQGLIYSIKLMDKRTYTYTKIFVPCYRKSDGEIGLYDIVKNKFYTNDGTGTFEKGRDINYITSSSIVEIDNNHSLYAIWEKQKYNASVAVNNGSVDVSIKQDYIKSDITFNLSTTLSQYISSVSCTNNQKAYIENDVLTVENISANTTCTVTYSDAGSTVLYTDGTLIINEKSEDRADNIVAHGAVSKEYTPFSNNNNYIFSSTSNVLWYNDKNSIKSVEIGQLISPTSTSKWFYDHRNISSGDFTNLDTSRVTSMENMFYQAGYNSSVKSFVLTGLSTWDTSNVTNMSYMFKNAGYYALTWSIGSLINWNTLNVDNMGSMFYGAGYRASTYFESLGSLEVYARDISSMFYNSRYVEINLILNNRYITSYGSAFYSAATNGGSIAVQYDCKIDNIEKIIKTKSVSSNVFKLGAFGDCRINLIVNDGTSDETLKIVSARTNATFTVTPTNAGSPPSVACTNNQSASFSGDTLTINNINMNTTCQVFYEDVTVLYEDGTLIINESKNDRLANEALHQGEYSVYTPFMGNGDYVFNSDSDILWYKERNNIKAIEIGQQISPLSTTRWFKDLVYVSSADLSNLDTSMVLDMSYMFSNTGKDSTVTSFTLTGLNSWNTSNVTSMADMFSYAGYNAKTWNIGNISSWNTENVSNMSRMFSYAGNSASTSFESITGIDGAFDIYATNVSSMFNNSNYMKATLNIYSNPASGSPGYISMFASASTKSGSLITVNYSSATTNINDIIGTKSTSSNVVKGVQLD